jgi:uncharacterized OsmC-like protein
VLIALVNFDLGHGQIIAPPTTGTTLGPTQLLLLGLLGATLLKKGIFFYFYIFMPQVKAILAIAVLIALVIFDLGHGQFVGPTTGTTLDPTQLLLVGLLGATLLKKGVIFVKKRKNLNLKMI